MSDTADKSRWVYSTLTPKALRGANRSVYDPSVSPTSNIIPGVFLEETYGGGSDYVSGPAYTDTIRVGDLIVPSRAVGAAENVSASFYDIPSIDGILGLSAYKGSVGCKYSTLINQPKLKLIVVPQVQPTFLNNALPTLKEPLFTAFLNRGAGGFFTFGYIPEPYSSSSFKWVNSTSDWSTTITGWAIGNRSNMTSTGLEPIVDTGTPFLLLPPEYCTEYYASSGTFLQGTYHGEGGFTYPCDATLPDLYLEIGDYTATIKGDQIAGPEVGGGCM